MPTCPTDWLTAAGISAAAVAKIEAALLNEGDGQALIDAIVQAIDAADIENDVLPALIRDAILNRVLSGNHDTAGTVGKVLQDAATQSYMQSAVATKANQDTMLTQCAAILVDTNELQLDWTNGGRLDLLVDAILEDTATTIPAAIASLIGADADTLKTLSDQIDGVVAGSGIQLTDVVDGTTTFGDLLTVLLAVLAGNSDYDATTRLAQFYARDGVTVAAQSTIGTTPGNRSGSALLNE